MTAVAAERAACAPAGAEVISCGVGPAAAAAGTAAMLGRCRYDAVLSAGIGGGFPGVAVGELAIASAIVFADLGVETPAGFSPISALGFGTDRYDIGADLLATLATRTGGTTGTILTVATGTGTDDRARSLRERYPDVVAEGMEGAGVAAAATCYGIPYAEVRSISNVVGRRDRDAWRVELALSTLSAAMSAIGDLT